MSFIGKPLIKDVAKKLDESIKLKGIAEMLDGTVFRVGLNMLDDKFADKVPEEYQDEVVTLLKAFVSGDYTEVTEATVKTIVDLVDIPALNEEEEGILVGGIVSIIVKLISRHRG